MQDLSGVLYSVILRLGRIERAEHQSMSDPLAEANNAIATMQAEAKAAIVELTPLVSDIKVERTLGDVPIGRAAWRGRDSGDWD